MPDIPSNPDSGGVPRREGPEAAGFIVQVVVAAALILAASACQGADPYADASGKRSGELIYRRRCIECHGLHAPGRLSDEQWASVLPDMAREARLSREDERLVLEYLQGAN